MMFRSLMAMVSTVLCFSIASLNLVFCTIPVVLMGLLKLLPFRPWQRLCSRISNAFYQLWIRINTQIINTFNRVEWQIHWRQSVPEDSWYLVIANHRSWVDIFVISHILSQRLPPPRFFLKHQLRYVPFLGLACWALDMPFMRRYSHSYLAKHPERRGQDLQSTQRACQKFRYLPTTIVNFVEGSRFTPAKRARRNSPYRHLLPAKAGGIAYSLAAMEHRFTHVLDISVAYPNCSRSRILLALLRGELSNIVVDIDVLPITAVPQGDYFHDKQYRVRFQHWLNERWQRKEQWLQYQLQSAANADASDHSPTGNKTPL